MADIEMNSAVYSSPEAGALPRAQGRKESAAWGQVIDGGGLCSTCNNAPACYYRAARGPALFCEMFDNYIPPVEQRIVRDPPARTEPAAALRAAEEQAHKDAGLCMNCRHRTTCKHPRLAGGVWHCEDYE